MSAEVKPAYIYAPAPDWMIRSPEISDGALRVYLILARYGGSGQIFPGIGTIAEALGRSERSVQRHITDLETVGALRRTARYREDGGRTSSLYELAGNDPFTPPSDSSVPPSPDSSGLHKERTNERETGTLTGSTSRQPARLAETDDSWRLAEFKDAIVAVCGEPSTKSGWSLVNRLATFIRNRGDPPESVALRATLMAQQWGPEKVTVASLEKHWTRYDPGRIGQLSQGDIDEYHRKVQDLRFRQRLDEIGET